MSSAASPAKLLQSSKEKTNHIRLTRLLMCGGTRVVREVFDSIIPPLQLPAKLKERAVFSRLNQMRSKEYLTWTQWNLLFPAPGTYVNSKSFDITLLFQLLREISGLKAPRKGWNKLPEDKDHSLSADLVRIKYYRNKLCHPKEDLEISDDNFKTDGKRIKDALLRMVQKSPSLGPSKDWEKEIDKLLTGPVTEEDEKNIEELKSWYRQDEKVKQMIEQLPDEIVDRLQENRLLQSRDRNDYGKRLVEFLKGYYSRGEWSVVLPFPWMDGDRFHIDKLYTPLIITEEGSTGSTERMEVANMFSPSRSGQDNFVSRILIEGGAGIGKSTYCKKIAYDWSKGKLAIPDVDLVLVIKCRDLKDGTNDLWQAIKEQILPEDLYKDEDTSKEVFEYIRDNQQRLLLIVDGFDEIPATAETTMKDSIKELVTTCKLLSNARVILTSRPGRCSDIRINFDKKLEMTGFSEENSRHFIENFCSSPDSAGKNISSGLNKTAAIRELTRCPLNAAFLCLVLEKNKGDPTQYLQSLHIGSLYHDMVFCVIKRYCVEKKGQKEQDVQDDTLMDEYHEILVVLGEIAFDLMKDNLTTFREEKLPDDSKQILIDIGFLIERKSLNTISPASSYSFFHSSIKEYFAALYVAECLRNGNDEILTSVHKFTENAPSSGVANSNHVQNVYYSLQRFNLAAMANLSSSEECINLIDGLAARIPKDIDVSQVELTRFDFIFTFICELLGNCQKDKVQEVLKAIAIPDVPLVLYLYNGRQALDGFISLLSLSTVKIKILRVEGLQAILGDETMSLQDLEELSHVLGKHTFLRTLCLFFLSSNKYFDYFFRNFRSQSVENLVLPYTPEVSQDSFEMLSNLRNLSSLDLSNSSILTNPKFLEGYGLSIINHVPLRVLKLCNSNLRSNDDVDAILRSLRTSTTLKELDLSGNDFSGGIYFDLEGSKLQLLRMRNCNLRPHDVDAILCSLRTTLIELDLSGNVIDAECQSSLSCHFSGTNILF